MIKKEKGIALVSLIIVIALMTIVASTVISISLDRFEINNLRKMYNDIELLQDKVSNYYLKYEALPVLRNNENAVIIYSLEKVNFTRDDRDNEVYYILDLKAMDGISLNYGEEGFKYPNTSDDIYIINEKSNIIYYVKGITLKEKTYHSLINSGNSLNDSIPPSSPKINIISGTKKTDKEGKVYYATDVEIEIIPGKDGVSGIAGTKYSLDGGTIWNELGSSSNIFTLTEDGTYTLKAKTYDNASIPNYSEEVTLELVIKKHVWESSVTIEPGCEKEGLKTYTCTVCGDTYTEAISAVGHNYKSEITTPPGVDTEGTRTYTCTACGHTYTEIIPAVGE